MSHAITCGEIIRRYSPSSTKREGFFIEPKLTLSEYIREKVKVLHQLGCYKVTKGDFATCTNEVQVDNKARSIIMAA